jgi:glycerophosphoryl diester phosphodiesterase
MKPHSCAEVEDKFIELTIAKLKEHDLLNPKRVMFISFSWHMCQELAKKLPGFTVQYLEGDKTPAEVDAAGVNGIDYHYSKFNNHNEWVKEAQKLGMTVNAWTVNKENNMVQMFDLGVNFLTTDNPLEARALMEKMNIKELK